MAEPSISELSRSLTSRDEAKRVEAAQRFCGMAEAAQAAAVVLVRACADPSEEVRTHVVSALEDLGPPLASDAEALGGLLRDDNSDVAYWAATLLGRLESDASAATPLLVQALSQSKHLSVRERCAWALGRIGIGDRAARAALERAAKEASPRLARLASEALARL